MSEALSYILASLKSTSKLPTTFIASWFHLFITGIDVKKKGDLCLTALNVQYDLGLNTSTLNPAVSCS